MPLANLGQPFGRSSQTFNVPAPAGSHYAGQMQMQAMAALGQALGSYLRNKKQDKLKQEDLAKLMAHSQEQQQRPQGRVMDFPGSQFTGGPIRLDPQNLQQPRMQSPELRDMQAKMELEKLMGGDSQYGVMPGFYKHLTPPEREEAAKYQGGLIGRPRHPSYKQDEESGVMPESLKATPSELFDESVKGQVKNTDGLYGETARKLAKSKFVKGMAKIHGLNPKESTELFDEIWDGKVHYERSGFLRGGLRKNRFAPRKQKPVKPTDNDPLGLGF